MRQVGRQGPGAEQHQRPTDGVGVDIEAADLGVQDDHEQPHRNPRQGPHEGRVRPAPAPVISHRSPLARRTRTTKRLPMKASDEHHPGGHQAASRWVEVCRGEQPEGGVHDEGHDAAPGEVDAVAGADQDAIEHEHDSGDGLAESSHQEDRCERVVDRRVVAEERSEERPGRGEEDTCEQSGPGPPAHHPGCHGAGRGDIPGAEVAAGDRLRGDGDGVEDEGQKGPQGQGQLMGGQVAGARAGGGTERHGVRRDQQRRSQGEGADHEGRSRSALRRGCRGGRVARARPRAVRRAPRPTRARPRSAPGRGPSPRRIRRARGPRRTRRRRRGPGSAPRSVRCRGRRRPGASECPAARAAPRSQPA